MVTQKRDTFAEIGTPTNPFPGLRPFEFDESHLFFGRDGQSEQLISKLGRTRFLAVVGSSGSGKSSLVRAGLLPALMGGFMTSAGSDWRIAILRPGNDPIGNLARALNAPDVFGSEIDENAGIQTAIAEANLRRGSRGIVEAVRQNAMPDHENLLVLVDQFEELFRFAREASRKTKDESERYQNDAAAFVKLLLEAHSQRDANIYVVLTMRSDFLGDCAQFWNLPETVNESQYLTPRLTRDQLREAITGPVAVGGGEITQRLVNRLLNEVGDNQDQLPVLQHLLMRAWDEWKEKRLVVEVKYGKGTVGRPHSEVHEGEAIDLCCYEVIGGMAGALSWHADEAFAELADEGHREVAEKLFKALTEKGPDNREIRRPIILSELCAVTNAAQSEVVSVIDTFRLPGRSFLMPPSGVALNSESLIDISHESLIRGWQRLRFWVDEEARSARIYRRLAETAELHGEGNAGLWGDPDLQLALGWQAMNSPNKDWARRYYPGFEAAIAFLQASEQKRADDVAERDRQQSAELERTQRELEQAQALADAQQQRAQAERKRLRALVVMVLFVLAVALFAFFAYRTANEQRRIARQHFYVANMNLAQKAIDDGEGLRAQELLNKFLPDSSTAKSDDVRGFYWYYLWRHNYREKVTIEDHDGAIITFAFSPDGKTIATASSAIVKLWDVGTREEVARFEGHTKQIISMAFSPDGKTLATASSDKTAKLWEVSTHHLLATLDRHTDQLLSIACSSDGTTVATSSEDKTVKLWEVRSGHELATLKHYPSFVQSLAFSPDGTVLATASGGDSSVTLWNVRARKELAMLKIKDGYAGCVAFSPDGKTLATGGSVVELWDVDTKQELAVLKGHANTICSVAFSPDGKTLATASYDETVKLWELNTRKLLATLEGHVAAAFSPSFLAAFSPDSKTLATAGWAGTVNLWDLSTRQEPASLKRHTDAVSSVAFSPDGKILATGSEDNTVKLWVVGALQEFATLKGHEGPVNSAAFSPDGKTLATASGDMTVKLWDLRNPLEPVSLQHNESVYSLAFAPDGETLASASADLTKINPANGTVRIWDLSTRQERVAKRLTAISLAFSPDGKTLATVSLTNKNVKLLDASTGKELATLEGETDPFARHLSPPLSVAFCCDGKTLATGTEDHLVKVWDVSTRQELATLKGHTDSVSAVGCSPDGKTLVSAGKDGILKLWDLSTRQELATLQAHPNGVRSVTFSPDGKTLATGGADRVVRLWFAATDEEVAAQRKSKQ